MNISLIIALIGIVAAKFTREEHNYWFSANRKTATSDVPYADVAWNYCDLKCLYLESIYDHVDFYVANFKDAMYKPNFSACYAKLEGGAPQLWNKVAHNN